MEDVDCGSCIVVVNVRGDPYSCGGVKRRWARLRCTGIVLGSPWCGSGRRVRL